MESNSPYSPSVMGVLSCWWREATSWDWNVRMGVRSPVLRVSRSFCGIIVSGLGAVSECESTYCYSLPSVQRFQLIAEPLIADLSRSSE